VLLFPPATRRRWTPRCPAAVALELQCVDRDVERARGALTLVLR
jgi:hypothetical protein